MHTTTSLKDTLSFEYVRSLGNRHHLIWNDEDKKLEVWINVKYSEYPYISAYTWRGHIVKYKQDYNDYKREHYDAMQEARAKYALAQETIKHLNNGDG